MPRGFGLRRLDAAFGSVAGMALEWKRTVRTRAGVLVAPVAARTTILPFPSEGKAASSRRSPKAAPCSCALSALRLGLILNHARGGRKHPGIAKRPGFWPKPLISFKKRPLPMTGPHLPTTGACVRTAPACVRTAPACVRADGRRVRADGRGVRADGRGVRADGRGVRADGRRARADGRGVRPDDRGVSSGMRPCGIGRGGCRRASQPRMPFTTCASSTPVRRTLRPRNLCVKRAWSMPRVCRIVACRSRMWTGFSTML